MKQILSKKNLSFVVKDGELSYFRKYFSLIKSQEMELAIRLQSQEQMLKITNEMSTPVIRNREGVDYLEEVGRYCFLELSYTLLKLLSMCALILQNTSLFGFSCCLFQGTLQMSISNIAPFMYLNRKQAHSSSHSLFKFQTCHFMTVT